MRIARNILTALVLLGLASHAALAERPADIARQHHEAEAGGIISDFREFLSVLNVASKVSDMMANDEFIQAQMGSRGFTSNVVSASGTPYVLAAYLLFLRQSRCPHCHPSCCES